MEMIDLGIFWIANDENNSIIYDKVRVFKVGKDFIDYGGGHFDKWKELSRKMYGGKFALYDCYHFPRGRVLYNCKTGKTLVYADQKILDRLDVFENVLVVLFSLKNYEFLTDEHYKSVATL